MSRTTTLHVVVDLATKGAVFTEEIAIREQVDLNIVGTGTAGASDLIAAVIFDGNLMALLQPLVSHAGYIGGVLDLNTSEIVAIFEGLSANAKRKCVFVIWDTTNECCVCNAFLMIGNNPYDPSMSDPTPVPPITPGVYALVANGVTGGSGHTHQNGDGADLTPYFLAAVAGSSGRKFRLNADGIHIDLCDDVTATWGMLTVQNGALTWVP
jgi:hypothetical protein